MKEQVDELLSLSKPEALTMLNETLPDKNGIRPLYVTAQTPEAELLAFHDPAIKLKVLGPMADVDAYYLGGKGQLNPAERVGTPKAWPTATRASFRIRRPWK